MKCVICKKGETQPGKVTVTLDRDGATVVFRGVPARICSNCGEEYVDGDITASLLSILQPRPPGQGSRSKSVSMAPPKKWKSVNARTVERNRPHPSPFILSMALDPI